MTKVVKPTLGERMSSFFRMSKSSVEEKTVENLVKPDDDNAMTEVVIDNKKIEANGIEDHKVDEKGDEEKTFEVCLHFLLFVSQRARKFKKVQAKKPLEIK